MWVVVGGGGGHLKEKPESTLWRPPRDWLLSIESV